MVRTLRLIATLALLGTAACAADGPLAPQLAPKLAAMQANADAPSAPDAPATRGFVLRTYCGGPRADGPPPLYVVDGRETASIGGVDPASVEHIELLRGAAAVARYGPRAAHGVVIITLRAGPAPSGG